MLMERTQMDGRHYTVRQLMDVKQPFHCVVLCCDSTAYACTSTQARTELITCVFAFFDYDIYVHIHIRYIVYIYIYIVIYCEVIIRKVS